MIAILSFILASTKTVKAAYTTEVNYITHYVYEQVNVLADSNGIPYSTETVSGTAPLTTAFSSQSTLDYQYIASSTQSEQTDSKPSSTQITEVTQSSTQVPVKTTSSAVDVTTSDSIPWNITPSSTTSQSAVETSAPSDFSGDATFYDVGLGACGFTNSDSELVAALNWQQWDSFGSMSNGNPVCNKKATLSYEGKSVTVTIVDKCMGCKYGDLDLSPAAFTALAPESIGRFKMNWSFI